MSTGHAFGGESTELKLSMVEAYLKAFTRALQGKFSLWYIDAFAGTGERTVVHPAAQANLFEQPVDAFVEMRRGSARIAIDAKPQFDQLVFMDNRRAHCKALRQLRDEHNDRKIEVIEGDANQEIARIVRGQSWLDARAVMFLDPYGMSVEWETLKAIQETKAIDVWYLVSLPGMFRQAARRASAIDDNKRAAITRMWGTDSWEAEWYQHEQTLFGPSNDRMRTAGVDAMQEFAARRLRTLFPRVLDPIRLHSDGKFPNFALFFAISNPAQNAIDLAERIASYILIGGKSSQV